MFIKTRIKIHPITGEYNRYNFGKAENWDAVREDMMDERHAYARYPGVQSVEDTDQNVVAVFTDGTVRMTVYRKDTKTA